MEDLASLCANVDFIIRVCIASASISGKLLVVGCKVTAASLQPRLCRITLCLRCMSVSKCGFWAFVTISPSKSLLGPDMFRYLSWII